MRNPNLTPLTLLFLVLSLFVVSMPAFADNKDDKIKALEASKTQLESELKKLRTERTEELKRERDSARTKAEEANKALVEELKRARQEAENQLKTSAETLNRSIRDLRTAREQLVARLKEMDAQLGEVRLDRDKFERDLLKTTGELRQAERLIKVLRDLEAVKQAQRLADLPSPMRERIMKLLAEDGLSDEVIRRLAIAPKAFIEREVRRAEALAKHQEFLKAAKQKAKERREAMEPMLREREAARKQAIREHRERREQAIKAHQARLQRLLQGSQACKPKPKRSR